MGAVGVMGAMGRTSFRTAVAVLAFGLAVAAQQTAPFTLEETTIERVRAAFRDGSLTCHALVSQYLARIEAHDKKGAALNAIEDRKSTRLNSSHLGISY